MTDSSAPHETSEDPPARPVSESSVWSRLREQVEQWRAVHSSEGRRQSLSQRLADRARLLRQRTEQADSQVAWLTFLAFSKKPHRYGIPLSEVAAVESLEHFTPVPNAPDFIRGVTPWRGSILSLLDLSRFFGREETGIADLKVSIIVQTSGRRLALAAHEVEEIISVPESELATSAELPAEIDPAWVRGIHDQSRMILAMNTLLSDPRFQSRGSHA